MIVSFFKIVASGKTFQIWQIYQLFQKTFVASKNKKLWGTFTFAWIFVLVT